MELTFQWEGETQGLTDNHNNYGSAGKESACNEGNTGSIPRLGRSPGGGNGNTLQYSCLENPMDGGAYSPRGHTELDTT